MHRPDEALALPVVAERLRTDLIRLARAASDTTRPSHTFSKISSRVTRRSRFSTSKASSANTCGSIGADFAVLAQLDLCQVELEAVEAIDHGPSA